MRNRDITITARYPKWGALRICSKEIINAELTEFEPQDGLKKIVFLPLKVSFDNFSILMDGTFWAFFELSPNA